jgi:hypothetical protein
MVAPFEGILSVVGIFRNEDATIRLVGAIRARTERRVGCAAGTLHDAGNYRAPER